MKIVTIVGARPQFIKAASVSRAISTHNQYTLNSLDQINEIIIHTGQHYDHNMSEVFFKELEIPKPHLNLEIGSGLHGQQTGQMLIKIEEILISEKPDWVLVYGDTNSTLAGALAAVKLQIPVAHVEAGLRSYNQTMPEEHNRVLTDHCSNILFCPTDSAVKNLQKEGISEGVHNVGDVMYDSILHNMEMAMERSRIMDRLNLSSKSYALATIHRAENTDNVDRLKSIFLAFEEISSNGLPVIIPLHPRTQKTLQHSEIIVKYTHTIAPVSYLDMLLLEKEAKLILTDSGGVQKEAFWMKVPCITLRDESEWVETVAAKWNILTGVDSEKIIQTSKLRDWPANQPEVFGGGDAAIKIINILTK